MSDQFKKNQRDFFFKCHDRWAKKISRDLSNPSAPDNWVWEQCAGCLFWVPLSGIFSTDWGVCGNSISEFDGFLRFSHDGCDFYQDRTENDSSCKPSVPEFD